MIPKSGYRFSEKDHAPAKTRMMTRESDPDRTTRRRFLAVAGGVALAPILVRRSARATPATMAAAIREVVGEAEVREGKVTLELPPLVENGNAVPMTVTVESPMSAADHVKSIHVFNEKNPEPVIVTFHLGPRAGKAKISTRVRLADSQTVLAIAEMS